MKIGPREEALYRQILDLKPTKGDRKRIELLEALVEAIAEDGWENVSYETLGKRVGMRKGHVAYYFATREAMLETAVRYAIAVGQSLTVEKLKGATTREAKLRAWVEGPFEWMERYPRHSAVMGLFYYLCTYSPRYRRLHTEAHRMGAERAAALLEETTDDLSAAQRLVLAGELQSILMGVLIAQTTTEPRLSLAAARDRAVVLVFRLVGLAIPSGARRKK